MNEPSTSSKGSFIQDKEIRELDTLITQDAVFYPRNLDSEKGAILAEKYLYAPCADIRIYRAGSKPLPPEGLSLEETNLRISKQNWKKSLTASSRIPGRSSML